MTTMAALTRTSPPQVASPISKLEAAGLLQRQEGHRRGVQNVYRILLREAEVLPPKEILFPPAAIKQSKEQSKEQKSPSRA